MSKTVSFCRHIEKEWLEQTLRWAASGSSLPELNDSIEQLLSSQVNTRENRRKARNLLTSIWRAPNDDNLNKFYQAGLTFHKKQDEYNLAIHWGMLVARKPFFMDVARFIGRTSKLNETFSLNQAQRRMKVIYGETETTSRALRAVLRTMIDLDVISRLSPSLYQAKLKFHHVESDMVNWLIKAKFISDETESRELDDALHDPVWFPFNISLHTNNIESDWFEQHQQGSSIYLFNKRESQ